ncbi:MAG: protein kinase [Planctomycetes bacterium]|nr:protein kinase [Planctomycetota bacterium]MCB9868660.1 protein kinase [Planctomycetota bacterium]
MAELTVENGPQRGETLTFSESDSVVIGSAETSSLRLPIPGVAGEHLVIKALKNGGFGVKALGGRFTLNGKDTEAARLNDGDLIEIAGARLRFGPRPKAPSDTGRPGDVTGVLGGYEIRSVLGRGGHGTVYRAEQLSLHREVALKVLPKETTQNPEFVGRFVAEARAAARLSHPNVVQVFDVGHDGDTYFLSMEIMEHGSLEDRLKRSGKIPTEDCLQLVIDAARGLAYAESMRIVHRDIKPDNLMVDAHGTVKIADLGLAMTDAEEQGRIVGTPHFMAPEQALNKPLDHRSDLYSLGCTFFRLLTGKTLFQRPSSREILRAHVKDEPEEASKVESSVPPVVSAIIAKLVEKDPDDRYQSANDLIEELEAVLRPPAKKGAWIAGFAAMAVVAIGAVVYLATREPKTIEKVKHTGVSAEQQAKLQAKLREQTAETERLRLLRNEKGLAPLLLAKALEEFSKNPDYAGTAAATTALEGAKGLRDEETKRVAAAAAQKQKVDAAKDLLANRVREHLTKGDLRGAAAALHPKDIDAQLLADPELKKALAEARDAVSKSANATLDKLRGEVEAAKTGGNIDGMLAALGRIEKLLDKATGWPAEAFSDREALQRYVKGGKSEAATLRTDLAKSRETDAWAALMKQTFGEGGVLDQVQGFDLAGASAKASALVTSLAGRKAEAHARQLAEVVAAAKTYAEDFKAAVDAGTARVPVEVGGATQDAVVVSFDGKEIRYRLNKDDSTLGTLSSDSLRGARLRQAFEVVKPDNPAHAAARLAFLGLHALRTHHRAATTYLAQIDPKDDRSGTGDQQYADSLADLNYVVRHTNSIDTPWKAFLIDELRATRGLARGLRAFSKTQYTRATGYLEGLTKNYGKTLAARSMLRPGS